MATQAMSDSPIYRFDDVRVDVAAMQVRRGADVVALEPQSFRLLQFLIENRDRVVSKEAIFETVWEGRAVSDNALTRAIAQIRKGLDDDPRTPIYIDTVPTVGYRFIGQLQPEPSAIPVAPVTTAPAQAAPTLRSPSRRGLQFLVAAGVAVVLAATGAALWWSTSRRATGTGPQIKPIQLTSFPGWVDYPTFSPDGKEIAFQWDNGGDSSYDIFVKQLGTDKPPLRITSSPELDAWPAWSPDGKTIAFVRGVSPSHAYLMLIPAHGGPERKLMEFNFWIDRTGNNPAWSHDSKWLVIPAYSDLGVGLYRVSVETGQATPIIPPQSGIGYRFPSISPDGKTLIYVEHPAYNGGKVWSVHMDSDMNAVDTPHPIDMGKRLIFQASFAPDGKQLITRELSGQTFLSNVDGSGEQRTIPQLSELTHDATISLRGNRLAYSMRRGNTNLWHVKLTGGTLHPEPLIASPQREVYPQFSPDSRKLAYHAYRGPGDINVWLADADGSNQQRVTDFHGGVTGTPHWSPDGKKLSFDSSSGGTYQVYTADADGKNIQQVTHSSYENFASSWSQDGKWIYYSSRGTGRHEVWKIPVAGGVPVQVTHNSGWMGAESLDGKTLFFCKDSPGGTLWNERLEDGHEELISNSIFRCNFAVSRQGVYYTTAISPEDTAQIMLYSFATKRSTPVMQMGEPEYGLTASPDGQYLVYGQVDNSGSDLMMIDGFR